MPAQNYSIEFDGYWRERNKGNIPSKSGIYCVYTCTRKSLQKAVTLHKLVYIGEAGNVKSRLQNHEKHGDWESHLNHGQVLCYSFAWVGSTSRQRCEAALIFKHKPPENTEYVNTFPFDQTTLRLSGETRFLVKSISVNRA